MMCSVMTGTTFGAAEWLGIAGGHNRMICGPASPPEGRFPVVWTRLLAGCLRFAVDNGPPPGNGGGPLT